MDSYIDLKFRIDVYLDTNILVDYIEGNYPALTFSLNYLAQTGYVTFRTSQYVLYEFAEVRKYNLYCASLDILPEQKRNLKPQIKRDNWKYGGVEYVDPLRTKIETQVLYELDNLKDNLGLETGIHVLHRELYTPSLFCVLRTPISKEDSLVLTSSILPNEDEHIFFSVILSGDDAYGSAYNENAHIIKDISGLGDANISFIKIKELKDPHSSRVINLREQKYNEDVIRNILNNILLQLLIKKNSSTFVGKTYKLGTVKKCIFFERDMSSLPLESDGNFMIVPKNLCVPPLYTGDKLGIRYFDTPITIPHSPDKDKVKEIKYSFLVPDSLKAHVDILSQAGNLVFYNSD